MLTGERLSKNRGKSQSILIIVPHSMMCPLREILTTGLLFQTLTPSSRLLNFSMKTIFVNLARCEGKKIVQKNRQNVITL